MTPPSAAPPSRPPSVCAGVAGKVAGGVAVLALVVVVAVYFVPFALHGTPPPPLSDANATDTPSGVTWYCSMTQCGVSGLPAPGRCPKCDMQLIPTRASAVRTGPREYAFDDDAYRRAHVSTVPAARRAVALTVELAGRVASDETLRAVITARTGGRVERLFLDHAGVTVRRGDPMADLFSPDLHSSLVFFLRAHQRTGTASALYADERADARMRLHNAGLTDEQIDHVARTGEVSDTLNILAPIGGVVVDRKVTRGQYVKEGDELFVIEDLSRVWVELDAFESDLAPLRFGQSATLTVPALPGRTFHGAIAFIDPLLDARTRAVRIRLDVPNPERLLKPGMLARARIEAPLTDDGHPAGPEGEGHYVCPRHPAKPADAPGICPSCSMARVPVESLAYGAHPVGSIGPIGNAPPGRPLVVPESAVLFTGKRAVVFVENTTAKDGVARYQLREIVPGVRAGPWWVVADGVAEGEAVVARGAFQIDSAMQILGKFSLMSTATSPGRDPYFGPGDHEGDPDPGWYAAAARAPWSPRGDGRDGSDERGPSFDDLFARYFAVGVPLVQDDSAAARRAAQHLAAWTPPSVDPAAGDRATVDEHARAFAPVADGLRALAQAEDLPAQRLAWRTLSGALTAWARRYGAPSPGGARLMFCPMAFNDMGAFWLQAADAPQVANPYHGQEMPRCGMEVEIIPPFTWPPPAPATPQDRP